MGPRHRKKQHKELSQAEIWDDSALVQSWDDALAEYKRYHSIHARGERVEDVIKAFEGNDANGNLTLGTPSGSQAAATGDGPHDCHPQELEDGEVDEGEVEDLSDDAINGEAQNSDHGQSHPQAFPAQQSSGPGMPAGVVKGAKDEALKNLMMSWYYAGYYTGFYEGQNSAKDTLGS